MIAPAILGGGGRKKFYVSPAGDDGAAGTLAAPWLTLGKLTASASSGSACYLERGGVWREQFSLPPNTYVGAYGTGAKPVISGADLLANASFALTSGKTYTYEISLPSIPATTNPYSTTVNDAVLMVWENSVRLGGRNGLASVNAVEAAAGSFFWDGVAKILYVHPADDGNPITNGKVYEASTRTLAIHGGDNVTVENLVGEKCYAKTTIGQQGYGILAYKAGTYRYCIGRQSWNHAVGVANGEIGDILFDACKAEDCEDQLDSPPTLFVGYKDPTAQRSTVTFNNCLATQPNAVGVIRSSGFYGHGYSVDNVIHNCQVERCYYGLSIADDPNGGTMEQTGTFVAKGCLEGVANYGKALSGVTVCDSTVYGIHSYASGSSIANSKVVFSTGHLGVCYAFDNATGANALSDTVFAYADSPGNIYANPAVTAAGARSFTANGCTFYRACAFQGDGANTLVSAADTNNHYGFLRIGVGVPADYASLAAWQAAGYDTNGTESDPGYDAAFFTVTITDPSGA